MTDVEGSAKNLLKSPIWQFVGAVIGIIAIAVSVYLYYQSRQTEELSYQVLAQTSLIDVEDEVEGRIRVYFDDTEVKDLTLFVVKIINTGTESIRIPQGYSAYERPINISFGKNAKVLTAEVSEVSPSNLDATVRIDTNRITIDPLLLNEDSSLVIEVIVEKPSELSVDWWLEGVRGIKEHKEQPNYILQYLAAGALLILIFFAVILIVQSIRIITESNQIITESNLRIEESNRLIAESRKLREQQEKSETHVDQKLTALEDTDTFEYQ